MVSFLWLLCFCSHALFSSAFIPQIIDKIEPAVVLDKGTAYLNCTMTIQDAQKTLTSWTGGKKQLISQGETMNEPIRKGPNGIPKYEVKYIRGRPSYVPTKYSSEDQDVYVYQLIIRFASQDDYDNYVCSIEIKGWVHSDWPSATGRLIVQRAPQILLNLKSQILSVGDSLSLTCEAEGSPPLIISWTRASGEKLKTTEGGQFPADGKVCQSVDAVVPVIPTTPTSTPINPIVDSVTRYQSATLMILSMCPEDSGIYRCHAQNSVGLSAEYDVDVQVGAKPIVRLAREGGAYGQAYDKNYEVTMECIVYGYPDPDLTWRRINADGSFSPVIYDDEKYDSEKINGYGAVGLDAMEFFFTLTIRNIKKGDYGNYLCDASNEYGRADPVIVNLFSQELCQGPVCPTLGNVNDPNAARRSHLTSALICSIIISTLILFYSLL